MSNLIKRGRMKYFDVQSERVCPHTGGNTGGDKMIKDRSIMNREALNHKQEVDTDAFYIQVLRDRWDIIGHDCDDGNMPREYKASKQKLILGSGRRFCQEPISDRFFASLPLPKRVIIKQAIINNIQDHRK